MNKKNVNMKLVCLIITVTIIFGLIFCADCSAAENDFTESEQRGIEQLSSLSKAFAAIARRVSPAVVYVQTETEVEMQRNPFGNDPFFKRFENDPFFKRFFQDRNGSPNPRKFQQRALGSGFIFDSKNGYIVTNNHVVRNAKKITVRLADNREFTAKIIGTDPDTDLAVIQISGANLPSVTLGDSDKLEVGNWVLAIGNPFGLSHTVTSGIISAKGRSGVGVASYENFIQTDAAINPGNSGGPLINIKGEVIGINTAIASRSGGNMGIGFAIPINMAKRISSQLIQGGKVVRGQIGVYIQDLDAELAKRFSLKEPEGVLVSEVIPDSPADKGGIKSGDIIIEFDGKKIKNGNDLRHRVANTPVGKKVMLVVIRAGKKTKLSMQIEERANIAERNEKPELQNSNNLGFAVQLLTPELARRLGYDEKESGVVVSEIVPGSPASGKLNVGDVIKEVDRIPIRSLGDYKKAMSKADKKKGVMFLVKPREGRQQFVIIQTEE